MRRRKIKGADEKLLSYKDYVLRDDIDKLKGKWNLKFKNDNPIYVEFGTGRGKFITTLAKQNPDINYIAFEIKEEVLIKGVEKANEYGLNNILFAWANVSNVLDYFEENELSRIYVNFCDPWPKARWAKRRLTHTNFLNKYRTLL
ncbi:tRNA (guanosine(46)-N7)-methyltransferase TrmB, partial [[Clostridium] dakarense]|uniref:tRNA (guanosine(46)-N7)-methyltransferase TrmB n=1 Tax=Faecalimicrobium dakarense TaxID=1301100 RepID=UPI0005A94D97